MESAKDMTCQNLFGKYTFEIRFPSPNVCVSCEHEYMELNSYWYSPIWWTFHTELINNTVCDTLRPD